MATRYKPTIGVEIHVQLNTKSKMFCACDNHSVNTKPNTNICPVCVGLPGSLPVVNKGAIEMAIKLGYGLNARIAPKTSFVRKNYFYPDLPKGYQISQLDEPIIGSGYVEILVAGEFKKIRIHHAHLEEDAGKLIHPDGADYSLVDFNRAGTPLIEIVSKPDIHSTEEAKRYLQEIYNIVVTLGICDGDMQHGNFKFDLNVSVSADSRSLGTKVELKNLNSFRNAERALNYEIARQTELLDLGEKIHQETRGWDDTKGRTVSQRGKEEAHDYRYFPEPDIPPLSIEDSFIKNIQSTISLLPIDIRRELNTLGLTITEQDILISQPKTMQVFQDARNIVKKRGLEKKLVNWLVGDYQAWLSENPNVTDRLSGKYLSEMILMIESGKISSKIAKEIFPEIILGRAPKEIVASKGLAQISDHQELKRIIKQVISNNYSAVADYKAGNGKILGFFVGQVMKETKGQANPTVVNKLMIKLLKEL